jgi:gliding motility-associated-like protein
MKKAILLFIVFLSTGLQAQQATFAWARQYGGPSGTIGDASYSLAYDNSGNVFICGQFVGLVDFDHGPPLMTLTSFGVTDGYIVKLDVNGNFLWARQFGGTGVDQCFSIATDLAGNVYVTGVFEGTANFNSWGSGFSLNSFGGLDAFITKLDANGNHIWTKQVGGTEQDIGNSIKADASGSIYTTGIFSGTADFDPGAAVSNLSAAGVYDNYVLRLDINGNFLWAATAGGEGEGGPAIAIDNTGNAYIAGAFQGTYDFNPGAGINNLTSQGGADIFVLKLTATGNFVWAKQMSGSTSFENAFNLALDVSGNIFVTGDFLNTVDFDPGPATFNLTSFGNYDIFLCKLDNNGNFVWAKQMGGADVQQGITVATDISGNVYTAGNFRSTADFDPGPCVYNMTSASGNIDDAYISKLDANGSFVWAKQLSGSNEDVIYSIAVTPAGSIYSAGYFREVTDFNPSSSVYDLIAWGVGDGFIHKMNTCTSSTSSTLTITTCLPYTVGCNTYTVSGVYTYYLVNSIGCDSIVTLNLTIGPIIGPTSTVNTCTDYVWNGQTYTTSGIYRDTLITSSGCDSIVTLNLTISNIIGATSTITSCSSYVWNGHTYTTNGTYIDTLITSNGCDSIVTLNLTISRIIGTTTTITSCSSYIWHGQTYTTNGTYIDTLITSNGCDSIVTLNLTISNIIGATSTITSCSSYVWHGQTYATSGTFRDTLVTSNGCDSIVTLNLNVNRIQGPVSILSSCGNYVWNGQAYTTNGTYKDTLITNNGCDSIATIQLTILTATSQTVSQSICQGQQYDGYTAAGIYIDTLIATNGCDSIRTLNLTIMPLPNPDLGNEKTICPGDSITLSPGQFASYLWQDGSRNSNFVATQTGLYSVIVTNNCGSVQDEVIISKGICDVWFPSAFTPNNDGRNDIFKVLGNVAFDKFQLSIYNRWGQRVFSTTDPSKGWDGVFNAQKQTTEVFVWHCTFKKSNSPANTTLKGTVTVIR